MYATQEQAAHRHEVYGWCMARTNIDIDEEACASVMRRYGLQTKREAVNLALRLCAVEPLSTTTISSAIARTASMQRAMRSASLNAMMQQLSLTRATADQAA